MFFEEDLRRNARYFPDKEAIIDGNRRITFLDLEKRSNQLANALMGIGVRKGCRVAIMAKNCYQYIEFFYAIAKIGAVGVVVNTRLSGKELSYIINDSEAQAVIFGETFFDVINQVRPNIDNVKHYIVMGGEKNGIYNYDAFIDESHEIVHNIGKDENDILILMYT